MVSTFLSARSRKRALHALSAALIAGCSGLAWAHPGQEGAFLHGLLHPLLGLDHVLAAVAVGIWAARLGGRSTWALPVTFVGAMAAGAAIGVMGFTLPITEIGIALSVAAIGLMVALDARLRPAAGAALIAAFAVFHGSAHGLEAAADFRGYAAGIMLGTLMLHASGVAAAVALKARPLVLRIAAAPMALAGLALLVNRLG